MRKYIFIMVSGIAINSKDSLKYYAFHTQNRDIIIRYGIRSRLAIIILIARSPVASSIQLSSVHTNAILKNNRLSSMDHAIVLNHGAFHQDCCLR